MGEQPIVTPVFHNKFIQGYMNHIGFPNLFCFPNQGSSVSDRQYSILTPCSLTLPKTPGSLCRLQNLEKGTFLTPKAFKSHFIVEGQHFGGQQILCYP